MKLGRELGTSYLHVHLDLLGGCPAYERLWLLAAFLLLVALGLDSFVTIGFLFLERVVVVVHTTF